MGTIDSKPWTVPPGGSTYLFKAGGDPAEKQALWAQAWAGVADIQIRVQDWAGLEGRVQSYSLGEATMRRSRSASSWQGSILPQAFAGQGRRRMDLILCLAGTLTVHLEAAPAVIVRANQSVVLNAAQVWRIHASPGLDCLTVSLDPADVATDLMTTAHGSPVVMSRETLTGALLQALLVRTFEGLARQALHEAEAPDLLVHLGRLVAEALAASSPGRVPMTAHAAQMTHRARRIAATRAADPAFRPAVLAAHLGVTPRYLATLFIPSGTTPGGYIRQIRLHLAWDRLTDPNNDSPIGAIAPDCGFPNAAQFATAITQAYGLSPRAIRQAARRDGGDAGSL